MALNRLREAGVVGSNPVTPTINYAPFKRLSVDAEQPISGEVSAIPAGDRHEQ